MVPRVRKVHKVPSGIPAPPVRKVPRALRVPQVLKVRLVRKALSVTRAHKDRKGFPAAY